MRSDRVTNSTDLEMIFVSHRVDVSLIGQEVEVFAHSSFIHTRDSQKFIDVYTFFMIRTVLADVGEQLQCQLSQIHTSTFRMKVKPHLSTIMQ